MSFCIHVVLCTGTMISSNITSPSFFFFLFFPMMSPAIKWAPGSCKMCQGSSGETELFSASARPLLATEGEQDVLLLKELPDQIKKTKPHTFFLFLAAKMYGII